MFETIYIGMSGLSGYAKGLRVIGNNLTNVNTPGFKSSQLQFSDLFYQSGTLGQGNSYSQYGTGLNTLATTTSFQQGTAAQTGNSLDVAIDGEGFFVMRNEGVTRYTRAGQFQFDAAGFLVNPNTGARVAGMVNGQLTDISLNGLRTNPPKVTSEVKFTGNLSSTATTDVVINGVKLIDAAGGEHAVTVTFKNNSATTPGSWTVTVSDAVGTLGTGNIQFLGGTPIAGSNKVSFTYARPGADAFAVDLDFSANVTSFSAGATSTLAMDSQNGYSTGSLTGASFNSEGLLITSYSNGQTSTGAKIALARFDSNQELQQVGNNDFAAAPGQKIFLGTAKSEAFGTLRAGAIEGSNVDLAQEFSNLIVMQRGYQASSHTITTTNEMIQQLFDMRGRR